MPIPVPRLDDRGFADLIAELVARIPAHTPEWTDPRPGDPGRTLLDLVAWLGDTILYRANLIPERNRLAFLRLLDLPMRPALPARGFVAAALAGGPRPKPVAVPVGADVTGGALPCETTTELEVLPIEGRCFVKRRPDDGERARLDGALRGLATVYRARFGTGVTPYVTTPVFGRPAPGAGFDVGIETVDRSLWIALLAPDDVGVDAARDGLGHGPAGARAINIALVPSVQMPADFAEWGPAPIAAASQWSISTGRWDGNEPEYRPLLVALDGTAGLTRQGVVRLVLPHSGNIGVPVDAQDVELHQGVGARPPRLDAPALAARLVAWIRLRLDTAVATLPLSWVGTNVASVEQMRTTRDRIVGAGDGRAEQTIALPIGNVDRSTFALAVEEPGRGFLAWRMVEDLGHAGRDDRVFRLDAEAGTVRFGDGIRGKVPAGGARILVVRMRSGGGASGNFPAGTLSGIAVPGLTVEQPLPLEGGQDAESLDEAERRLPARLAHGERAVTPDDFRALALTTPATRIARAELLPRFKPQQRLADVTGVVSVMVLPPARGLGAPNPRPDRTTLERVHSHLDARRTVGCELYVIGVDYVSCALSVAVRLAAGAERDATLRQVRVALQSHLHPLVPGGRHGAGWALGETVREGELEVVVARVPGIEVVGGVRLFERPPETASGWRLARRDARGQTLLELRAWQLPELHDVVVVEADEVADDPGVFAAGDDDPRLIPIPTIPERC
jgi:predicted phage baseplate assembly protein